METSPVLKTPVDVGVKKVIWTMKSAKRPKTRLPTWIQKLHMPSGRRNEAATSLGSPLFFPLHLCHPDRIQLLQQLRPSPTTMSAYWLFGRERNLVTVSGPCLLDMFVSASHVFESSEL
jgi:hypothetical protein